MAILGHIASHPLRLALSTLKVTCLAHLTVSHLVQISPAQGPSMLPTFSVYGDWILADMKACRGRRIAVGDLVLYKIPVAPDSSGIKRLIGLPGDYVSIANPDEPARDRMIQVPVHLPTPRPATCLVAPDPPQGSRGTLLDRRRQSSSFA